MASLVNFDKSKQRIHKERSQLASRQHLGNLEKKKDYKLRAQQHQEKKKTLKVLRQKALEKNPDEFYFHMINSKLEEGVHTEKSETNVVDTVEQEKLMRTQNMRYVSFKLQLDKKKIEKSLATLHMCGPSSAANTRTVFVDGKAEAKRINSKKLANTHPILIDRTFNRPKLSTLKTKPITTLSRDEIRAVDKERERAYDELCKRIVRERELRVVQQKLLMKKFVAQSGRDQKPKLVKKGNSKRAPVYKWRLERQK